MNIGYACMTVGVPGTRQRTCALKNAAPDVLRALISENLGALSRILDYNIANEIKLFRISSDIIPFGSHPANRLKFWEEFAEPLAALGEKARANGLRISMHPGQYTVLNSPDPDVAERAAEDLRYHCRFLDALGLDGRHKIILHTGGTYGDKKAATERFVAEYRRLDPAVRRRLVLENDDRQYTVADVLAIGLGEGIPVVFDNLHHAINPDNSKSEADRIAACAATWKGDDGPQKIHYSRQDPGKRPGAHSHTADAREFAEFYARLPQPIPDIMIEVKDKNLSALKCINAVAPPPQKARLEKEWERYKYAVLERSPQAYGSICERIKDAAGYPATEFYREVDAAMSFPVTPENAAAAARHLWERVGATADEKKWAAFEKNTEKLKKTGSGTALKKQLWETAIKEKRENILNSLYFAELYR